MCGDVCTYLVTCIVVPVVGWAVIDVIRGLYKVLRNAVLT
jgi:hypothetical protein